MPTDVRMSPQAVIFLAGILAYVLVVCWMGLAAMRRASAGQESFLLAGRSLGPILGGASLMANQVSAGTTVGVVGFHYFSGISYAWTWPLAWLGWVVAAMFVAPKMRDFAGITLPDYFAARFNSEPTRLASAVFILFAYAVMLSAQYQGGALLLVLITDMPFWLAALIIALITVIYTVLGGMYSNAYVGLLQGVLLIVGYGLAIPFLLAHLGGMDSIAADLYSLDPRLTGPWFDWRRLLAFSLALGLGIAVAPYEVSAMYSLTNRRTARLAIGWSFFFQAFIAVGVLVFGLAARKAIPYLDNPDLAAPVLSFNFLPAWIGTIVLVAVISALTRTASALLLTSASEISHDIYAKFLRPDASEREKVFLNRVAIIVLGLLPVVVAFYQFDLVNFVVLFAVKLMASAFFAPVVIGLNWRRGTKAGGLAAMVGGVAACLLWNYLGHPYYLGLEAAEAGLITSTALFLVVSLLTPRVPEHCLAPFFRRTVPPRMVSLR